MDSQFHFAQCLVALQRTGQLPFFYDVGPEQAYSPEALYKTQGEIALMCAVLEDAVTCFQKQFVTSTRQVQRLAREAEAWFFTDDPHWPFSFVNICAVLGLDPQYIRQGLAQERQRSCAVRQRRRRHAVPARRPLKVAA